ncbi:EscU/YscU/HrcU family type III secretion system export apparatus switch protein [Bacillus testis]|uniref:EscU/YscU/HrcU family type III secretion system export apparatus switch protein n=1 Tax=Bacillus testis TaxID=1622072 RepID=UPI00067F06F6|nr:EscU/YscU/HrcU family type III secretion system export apparatus switch protein [Bacillus testis]
MTEKRKEAIALKYDREKDVSPRLVAKGKGKIAESILERAKENHIPIQEDASLAELLGKLNINEAIPPQLYEAVAEVFAFLYRLDKEAGKKNSHTLK